MVGDAGDAAEPGDHHPRQRSPACRRLRDRILEKFFASDHQSPGRPTRASGAGIDPYKSREIVEARGGPAAWREAPGERVAALAILLPAEGAENRAGPLPLASRPSVHRWSLRGPLLLRCTLVAADLAARSDRQLEPEQGPDRPPSDSHPAAVRDHHALDGGEAEPEPLLGQPWGTEVRLEDPLGQLGRNARARVLDLHSRRVPADTRANYDGALRRGPWRTWRRCRAGSRARPPEPLRRRRGRSPRTARRSPTAPRPLETRSAPRRPRARSPRGAPEPLALASRQRARS